MLVQLTAGTTYRVRIGNADLDATEAVVVRAERTPAPLTATVVDSDGDGTSTNVGSESDLVMVGGAPAIAYFDGTNGELRFATRSAGGVWSDVLVDADGDGTSTEVGRSPSLAVLSNGQPVIAYYDATNAELRFATRSAGVWSDVLIDADGDGTSTDVGQYPGLIELATGLAVSYVDETNTELRFARFSGGSWTDALVFRDEVDPSSLVAARVALDSAGNPVVAATDDGQGNHVIAWWNGASWDIEWDLADRHLAELDFDCAPPRLLIDDADGLHLVWTDCNYAYTMAVSERDASGAWSVRDVAATHLSPSSPDFAGTVSVRSTSTFGAAWMPNGLLAVTFQNDDASNLWMAVGP